MEVEESETALEDESMGVSGSGAEYDRSELPELLRVYYSKLFPYDKYYEWLQYGDKDMFSHREFSFTLEDDVYVRYQSFDSQQALEDGVRKNRPYKIDIGAIFSVKPIMKNRVQQANFKALRKELVFDIDMTDYDDIRTCCKEAAICSKCWLFMTVAIRIIDRALREDFGFHHLLWVYSGRRGVHCWVCDDEAIQLSQEARCAVVEYLTLVKGGGQQAKKVKLNRSGPLHPSVSSALAIVKTYFPQLLREQDFLATEGQWEAMLSLLPDSLRTLLLEEWKDALGMTSVTRWGRIKQELSSKRDTLLLDEIMLQWCYPRLDVNVSKGINHLLKSPPVHTPQDRVCVPIDTRRVDDFNPFTVPTVNKLPRQICTELNLIDEKTPRAYMKTSLQPYMEYFTHEFLIPMEKAKGRRRAKEPKLEF